MHSGKSLALPVRGVVTPSWVGQDGTSHCMGKSRTREFHLPTTLIKPTNCLKQILDIKVQINCLVSVKNRISSTMRSSVIDLQVQKQLHVLKILY